jgi:hypothetical protein
MSNLNFDLLEWQQGVFEDNHRFKVIVAGRRCGKSRFALVQTIIKGLECKATDASVMYIAPTYQMVRVLAWDALLNLGREVIESSNINDGRIRLVNGVSIYTRGADNPDSLRGMKLAYCIIDEAKDIKPEVFEMIIRPALSDMRGGCLFIGTPTPGESLFRDYYDLGQSGDDPEWRSWHFTTENNELIDKREIESARRTMSTMAFRQEYLADFNTMGSGLFKEEWFKSEDEPPDGDYYIAVDLAGFEEVSNPNKKKYLDDTAIAVVKITDDGKWWIKKVETFRKDVRETALRILLAIRTYKPIMIGIEKGSLMRAVMPYLSDLMNKNALYVHIEPISTSGSSKKGSDAIANRVLYALQGRFEHQKISFSKNEDHSKLKQQLLVFPSPKSHDDAADALSLIAHLHETVYGSADPVDDYEILDPVCGF